MSRSRKVGEAITASDEREGERGLGSKGRHTVLDYILNRKTNRCQGLCWWDWPRLNVGCALKLQACSLPLLPIFCDWTFVSSGNFVLRGHSLKQLVESRPDAFLCIILYEKYVFRENWSEWGQTWRKKHLGLLMLACNFSIKSKWPKCERFNYSTNERKQSNPNPKQTGGVWRWAAEGCYGYKWGDRLASESSVVIPQRYVHILPPRNGKKKRTYLVKGSLQTEWRWSSKTRFFLLLAWVYRSTCYMGACVYTTDHVRSKVSSQALILLF